MFPDKHLRGLIHGLDIKAHRNAPDTAAVQRKTRAAVNNAVKIAALNGVKARMKLCVRFFCCQYGDGRFAQVKIEAVPNLVRA